MKRIFTSLLGVSLLAITTSSCSKEGQDKTGQQAVASQPQVISANVPAEQTYVLDMGRGTSLSIKIQALHYQLSEIATTPEGNAVYKYIAAKGYAGTDEVTLQQTITSTSEGGGCGGNYSGGHTTTTVKTIAIKFNVAN